jgi:hypothetical protein
MSFRKTVDGKLSFILFYSRKYFKQNNLFEPTKTEFLDPPFIAFIFLIRR